MECQEGLENVADEALQPLLLSMARIAELHAQEDWLMTHADQLRDCVVARQPFM